MDITNPSLQVLAPMTVGQITLFPLTNPAPSSLRYLLCDEAIAASLLTVEEVSQEGNVPKLHVYNRSPLPVLFLEGQELLGAKQNRVLNTTVLVAADQVLIIPVSCVEAGRWHARSRFFNVSNHIASLKLRHELRRSVHRSLDRKQGHRSDQGKVWEEVAKTNESLGVQSETSAMSDAFATHYAKIEEARQKLVYPEGAVGFVTAIGPNIVAVDVFDQPVTCQKLWDRFVRGSLLEGFVRAEPSSVTVDDVHGYLQAAFAGKWEKHPGVGLGEEWRKEDGKVTGTALVLGGTAVHTSFLSA
jgi:hypothetical protein